MITVEFLPAAREELLAVAERYDAETPGLGEAFLTEVERAVERITAFPAHGSLYLADTRRVLLRRFPFSVVYVADANVALVIAVAHHSRRPGYWRKRL